MKKQETKAPEVEPVRTEKKSRRLSDEDVFNLVIALHGKVKEEMRTRQIAGDKWRSLLPVDQRLFIVLQGMKMGMRINK